MKLADILPGNGTPTAPVITDKVPVQESEKKDDKEGKEGADPEKKEGEGQEGKDSGDTGKDKKDIKPEDKTGTSTDTGATDDEEGEDAPDDPQVFWNTVRTLRGDDLEFKFPEDMENILSPEAVHHIIKQAEVHAADRFDEDLSRSDPRGYAYLLHRDKGGSDEEFFARKTEVLPEYDKFKEDVNLQSAFYKRSLVNKGIDPDQAEILLKTATEKKQLFALADKEYKEQESQNVKDLEDARKEASRLQKVMEGHINKLSVTLKDHIMENKGLGIIIPDAKRTEFLDYFSQMINYDKATGRFYVNMEIDAASLPKQIEALWYLKNEGDLSAIIKKEAAKQNARKIQLSMKKDPIKTSTGDTDQKRQIKQGVHKPLSDLL